MKLYHILRTTGHSLSILKKHGLLSPQALYDIDKELFMKRSKSIYEERAKKYLHKKEVSNEDVLKYLNGKERYPFTSESIFFIFDIDNKIIDRLKKKKIKPNYLIEIDNKILKNYEPIVVNAREKTIVKWNWLENNYQDIKPKKSKSNLFFATIPHLAVNCYNVAYKDLILKKIK